MLEVQNYSYHCHTHLSDGKNTIAEMARRAKELGFCELGISDHLIVHKNMYQSSSWPYIEQKPAAYVYNRDFKSILDKYKRHCDEIHRVSKQENIKLLAGFEVDYFPYDGWVEELKWFVSQLDFDYLHSGNHFFCDEKCEQIINLTFFANVCKDISLYKEYISRHFDILRQAVESGLFCFLAHPDYLRRFCGTAYGTDMFWNEKNILIDALERSGIAMEMSTKGLRKIGDFYPDITMLQAAIKHNIPILISDDAHCVAELGADFDRAEQVLQKTENVHRFKF